MIQRLPFFYGWVIVAVAMAGLFCGAFMATSSFSVFMRPIAEDLGWSMSALSGAITVGTIGGAAVAPLAGRWVDLYGTRALFAVGGLLLGGAMVVLALTSDILVFYGAFSLGRIVFQGAIMASATVAVSNWFIRRRGRAVGIALIGNAAGIALSVPVSQYLIQTAGWRTGLFVLGLTAVLLLGPASALLMRRRPEDLGLRPDGVAGRLSSNEARQAPFAASPAPDPRPGVSDKAPRPASSEVAWTLGAALRTPNFWALLMGNAIANFGSAGLTAHAVPFMVVNGVAPAIAAAAVSVYAVTWAIAGFVGGMVGERVVVRYALAVGYTLGAASILALLTFYNTPFLFSYTLLLGACIGSARALEAVAWADYFGRYSLGSIRGFGRPVILVANATGPLAAGAAFDVLGGYQAAFLIFAASFGMGALLVLLSPPPPPPQGPEAATSTPG